LTPDAVRAFRLQSHNLTARLAPDGLLDAAGRCAVQDSPPGSALLALHARVRDVTADRVAEAIASEKSLVRNWAMRGAPFCYPVRDAAVFTLGALPPTPEGMGQLIVGVLPSLQRLDLGLPDALGLLERHLTEVLSHRQLDINELGQELADRICSDLPQRQATLWQAPGPYAPGQPLGQGVVHFCLRVAALQGIICFAPRVGNRAPVVLVDQWFGEPFPDADPKSARAELLRRFLSCYGPATPASFAAWLGVRVADTDTWWQSLAAELTEVNFGGRCWLAAADLENLRSAPSPTGVRLLPPRDPYTQMPDHRTIVAAKYHQEIWRPVGEPGTILVRGRIVGTWRTRKAGRRLTVSVRSFEPIAGSDQEALMKEAGQVAALRGADSVDLRFDPA
jgi:hypothetical protein